MAKLEKTSDSQFLKITRMALLTRREELVSKLDSARCRCKEVLNVAAASSKVSNHPADKGADGCIADIIVKGGVTMMSKREIEEVDQALERLDKGIYGFCEECGEDIEAKRLAINLTARRCVSCEKDMEADRKRGGRRSTACSAPLS